VGTRRRLSALEDYIESRVRERLEQELEEMLNRLERGLTREEFARVLEEIVVSEEAEDGC